MQPLKVTECVSVVEGVEDQSPFYMGAICKKQQIVTHVRECKVKVEDQKDIRKLKTEN